MELRQIDNRTEAILNITNDAIILSSFDGVIQQVNPAFSDLFAYPTDAVLGQSLLMLATPDSTENLLNVMNTVVNTLHSTRTEITMRGQAGSAFIGDLIMTPIMEYNNFQGLITSVRDITEHKRTAQQLQESEEQLRATFEQAAVGIARVALDGRYLHVNQRFSDVVEYTPGELLKLTFQDITHPDDLDTEQAYVSQLLAAQIQTFSMEKRYIRKDQSLVWTDLTVSLVRTASGEPRYFIAIVEDASDRKQYEQALSASEKKYRALVDFAPDPIVIVDATGHIVLVNRRMKELFGYELFELMGQPVEVLVPEHLREMHGAHRASFMSGPLTRSLDTNHYLVIRHKNGTAIPVKIGLSPIQTGDEQLVMAYIIDVTAQRQLEDSLRAALAKEKELNELKSQFVSMVSHEFKTPLTVILSATDTLRKYADRLSEADKSKRLETIRAQVNRLTDLLNDTLILTRVDTVGLDFNPTPLDLERFCYEIAEEIQFTCQETHQIAFSSTAACGTALIDARLLEHVLINLLSNAVKYSPNGGTVYFDLACASEEVTIQVKDEGIGIPKADQQHLFETFRRASNVESISGTGLGLVIARQSIKAHGGTIGFESEEGVGTTFTITIPISN